LITMYYLVPGGHIWIKAIWFRLWLQAYGRIAFGLGSGFKVWGWAGVKFKN